VAKPLIVTSIVVWFLSWLFLWVSAEWKSADWIFEPAVVGLTLGLVSLLWFAAIYFREEAAGENLSHRLRSAIAGSVVLLFLLLVVDLLTIAGLRESLEELNLTSGTSGGTEASAEDALTFVEGMLDTFKWVVISVVGFYFGAGALESVGNNYQQANETRAEADVRVAEANRDAARATAER
jgi:hypothetical protein